MHMHMSFIMYYQESDFELTLNNNDLQIQTVFERCTHNDYSYEKTTGLVHPTLITAT